MPGKLPAGPYRIIDIEQGVQAPWYIIPFDKEGRCEGPLTRQHMLDSIGAANYTDVFIFSHGWNNDWQDATRSYDGFLAGYSRMRNERGLKYPRPFRPLLIGIFWPSAALVLPWERGPQFAGFTGDETADGEGSGEYLEDAEVAQERQEISVLTDSIKNKDVERFYELAQKEGGLSEEDALELARMLVPVYRAHDRREGRGGTRMGDGEELPPKGPAPTTNRKLVDLWMSTSAMQRGAGQDGLGGVVDDSGEGGLIGEPAGEISDGDEPQTAGLLDALDPRRIIRAATVLLMKDRAGTVGSQGVGPMLRDILSKDRDVRVHMVGHSYGCKVVLSAICSANLPRHVNSALLLQPAVSYLCFAEDATGTGRPGGYRSALTRVEQPILSTFSSEDGPLHDFFHLAVRRESDLGEERMAGGPPPSRYAALGGYGPDGCDSDCREIAIKKVGDPYQLAGGAPRIYGLDGAGAIHGHGDISNDFTWWALYSQIVS